MSDDRGEVHPLVRAVFLLQNDVAWLRARAGVGKWQPGPDVDIDIARDLWPARPFRRCELCDYVHLQEST